MISDSSRPLTRRRLRSPRSAALAGIVFSLLLGTSVVLIQLSIPDVPPYEIDWLVEQAGRVSVAVTLVPFAGIAFLWFMGVIRDQLGEMEDQFFSSVFFGSGAYIFGRSMIKVMGGVVTLRMAGVFMVSSGTI